MLLMLLLLLLLLLLLMLMLIMRSGCCHYVRAEIVSFTLLPQMMFHSWLHTRPPGRCARRSKVKRLAKKEQRLVSKSRPPI
uniref:Putative secreted protein n=1 Tax=Anopheles darlingi TaxID=43151 RepID=A0A2M4DF93_ANODA